MDTIYQDIAERTGGNVYIGVVGPVRTGKSTLIKRIMEQLVIPGMEDPYRKERARDELPQSGSGKTIMTSEPKFVPEEAVEITPDASATLRVRMIDSVGYMVAGAVGAEVHAAGLVHRRGSDRVGFSLDVAVGQRPGMQLRLGHFILQFTYATDRGNLRIV